MSITVGYTPQKGLTDWAKQADIKTVPALFARARAMNPHNTFLAQKKDGHWNTISWQQASDTIDRLAMGLMSLGVATEDRVAQISNNRPEWVFCDIAVLSAGAIHVPIYPTLAAPAIGYILHDCGAHVALVATADQLGKVLEVLDELPDLQHVVVYDDFTPPASSGKVQIHRFKDVVDRGEAQRANLAAELKQRQEKLTAENVASLVYTSGTTGEPKGAMLMHGNFLSNCTATSPLMHLTSDDVELSFLPLCHVFERIAYYSLLYAGATVYYAESIDAVPANLVEVCPTMVASVPRVFEKIHSRIIEGVEHSSPMKQKIFQWAMKVGRAVREHHELGIPLRLNLFLAHKIAHKLVFSKIHARVGGRVRVFISGGAPLRRDIAEFFADVGLCICEGYGLTETSPVITFNRPESVRFGTVGQLIPHAEMKIADDGEIMARGPNIMLGYFNKPEDTRAAIEPDGWFHTGDIGRIDSDGYLAITDRKKELLVMSNGKNVAPQPIENLLKSSNYIEQAMVIGDNRNFISALVVPNLKVLEAWAANNGVSERGPSMVENKRVQEFLEKHVIELCQDLSQYERIKKIALLGNELSQENGELTPTLKFKRRVILEHYKDKIEAMYEA